MLTIDLGDGTSVTMSARPMGVSPLKRPERLADVLDELTTLAESGDVDATFRLGDWLDECQRIFVEKADLEKAIARVRSERIAEYPEGSGRLTHRVHDATFTEEIMKRHFAFCDGVSADQRGEAGNWLELAAASGHTLALHEQLTGFRLDVDRYFQVTEKLWREHGHLGSLSVLAILYRSGRVPGGEPDYVRAYAHQFAHLKIYETIVASSVHPQYRRMLQTSADSLSSLVSYLTPQQTAEAEALGRRLLRENRNCCVSLSFGQTYEGVTPPRP